MGVESPMVTEAGAERVGTTMKNRTARLPRESLADNGYRPAVRSGMMIDATKAPDKSEVEDATGTPSKLTVTTSLGAKFVPTTPAGSPTRARFGIDRVEGAVTTKPPREVNTAVLVSNTRLALHAG